MQATQRATATALGVSHVTIGKDINGGNKLPNHTDETATNVVEAPTNGNKLPVESTPKEEEKEKIEQPSILQKPADETRARGAAVCRYVTTKG